jgi:hypothetical protein
MVWLVAMAACCSLAAGCGKKGAPLAPLRPVPARIDDLTVRRLGNDIVLQFTIPSRNADSTTPAAIVRVDAYAITGNPQDPAGRPLEARDFLKYADSVAGLEVEPPPPPAPKEGPPPPPPPPDPRPAQGERVSLFETLQPADFTPFEHPRQKEYDERLATRRRDVEETGPVIGPLVPPREEALGRVYVVTGRTRRKESGPLSARVRVPLTDVPATPAAPAVRYDETRIYVGWTAPPGTRRRIQEPVVPAPSASPAPASPPARAATEAPVAPVTPPPAQPPAAGTPAPAPIAGVEAAPQVPGAATPAAELPPLPGRPIFAGAIPHTYNVYDHVPTAAAQVVTMPSPLNPKPLETPSFEDARLVFGTERCYVVRMVEAHGAVTIESPPSPPVCVTPRDTFPPAAPRDLAAVASEGAVNLIWEPNTEADFAGYLVLRGEAPGARLEALTPSPIRETTFRDANLTAGTRYVYAVVAVDNATPQNVSVESNRVEETAR